jgi:hypothetical protein
MAVFSIITILSIVIGERDSRNQSAFCRESILVHIVSSSNAKASCWDEEILLIGPITCVYRKIVSTRRTNTKQQPIRNHNSKQEEKAAVAYWYV